MWAYVYVYVYVYVYAKNILLPLSRNSMTVSQYHAITLKCFCALNGAKLIIYIIKFICSVVFPSVFSPQHVWS